jgi:diaminopimelate epimerase
MIVQFSKYHGTGNDFIMIDARSQDLSCLSTDLVRMICDRRFGIGADGLILLEPGRRAAFKMRYFNSDGHEGTMCGNGGRCITAYAHTLGIITLDAVFEGIDGMHSASLLPNGEIRLKLKEVDTIRWAGDGYLVDTGSPHFVVFVSMLDEMDVESKGREIRNQPRFGQQGVNVNFVEAETYSCGTGVVAAAICSYFHFKSDIFSYHVRTRGGNLNVSFKAQHHTHFTDIYLTGAASHVYDGSIEISS